jgi:hypothetical protein
MGGADIKARGNFRIVIVTSEVVVMRARPGNENNKHGSANSAS